MPSGPGDFESGNYSIQYLMPEFSLSKCYTSPTNCWFKRKRPKYLGFTVCNAIKRLKQKLRETVIHYFLRKPVYPFPPPGETLALRECPTPIAI